uniref:Uncharacterized protein n=1 Tax=Lepeophtheirus salmonis TaxID=72036 RepID=A0A0K2TVC2_LEPSM
MDLIFACIHLKKRLASLEPLRMHYCDNLHCNAVSCIWFTQELGVQFVSYLWICYPIVSTPEPSALT